MKRNRKAVSGIVTMDKIACAFTVDRKGMYLGIDIVRPFNRRDFDRMVKKVQATVTKMLFKTR